jgi:hypothetical protein
MATRLHSSPVPIAERLTSLIPVTLQLTFFSILAALVVLRGEG